MNNQIVKSSPRDVFINLLGIGTLYVSAGSLITLFFQYINVAFPDPLNPYYDAGSPIRWALASLIIIFPVFLWTSRFLRKDLIQNPVKSELKIRKWLVYFTLFAAAILIIGDLVALIYNFLEGELTVRFALKIAAILVVAAAVFRYYFYDLRRQPGEFSRNARVFVWSVIAIVAVVVIYGFYVAGSPFKQRLVRFDEQKISDLQVIQGQIVNFWIQKERLPNSLDELKDPISGFAAPQDPQSGEGYAYKRTDKLSFELCAKFNLPADEKQTGRFVLRPEPLAPGVKGQESWKHGAGDYCFSRTIDPELYKPQKRAGSD